MTLHKAVFYHLYRSWSSECVCVYTSFQMSYIHMSESFNLLRTAEDTSQ